MNRTLTLIALAASTFALPALAEDAASNTDSSAAAAKDLALVSGENDARQHLIHQGYVNISPLMKDELGRWSGTASKDGKVVIVAVDLRAAKATPATN